MSLLSAADQEIEKIFNLKLVKKYVTDKINAEDEEVDLPDRENFETNDEWRDACVDAKEATKRKDCIFRANNSKKMEEILELGAKLLVPGAFYVVFEGELTEKSFNACKVDYGKPCTPKSVDQSLRHLARKKHGEVKSASPPRKQQRGTPNRRGGSTKGRGGNWQMSRGGFQGGWGGVPFVTSVPFRPGFPVF